MTGVTQADAGIYQCIANNVVGSAYATAVLTVTASRRRQTLTTQSTAAAVVSSLRPSGTCLLHPYLCPAVFTQAMLASAGISGRHVSVCLSVRPSVTSRCYTEMAKRGITQTTPHNIQGTPGF